MKGIARVASFLLIGTISGLWSCQTDGENEIKMTQDTPEGTVVKSKDATNNRIDSPFREDVGSPIKEEVALAWIESYTSKNPNGIRSHFFGKNTFERLLTQKDVVGISIQYAYNDNGVQQLILVGIDSKGNLLKGEGNNGYEDVSAFCPTTCPNN